MLFYSETEVFFSRLKEMPKWKRGRRKKGLEEREKHIGSALFGFELEGVA